MKFLRFVTKDNCFSREKILEMKMKKKYTSLQERNKFLNTERSLRMSKGQKINVKELLSAVAADTYQHIRTLVLQEAGDVFLNWAEKHGASFESEKVKGAALEELAENLPEPTRASSITINGVLPSQSKTLTKAQPSRSAKSSANGQERKNIDYPRKTKKDDKYRCLHILGPTAKTPGADCGNIANYWHFNHNEEYEDCGKVDNGCRHSRCARHVQSASTDTKNAKFRQKGRKSAKLSVDLGEGKKLEKSETNALLKEKRPNKENINNIIAGLKRKKKESSNEKKESK